MPVPAIANEYHFTVTHMTVAEHSLPNASLTAAYFIEDGAYTLFKDRKHGVVEALRTDLVIRITRGSAIDDGGK